MNKYVNLSIDFKDINKPKILKYMKKYHIITDATLGILERDEHGKDNGQDALLSLCKYLIRNGINVKNELDSPCHNAPGHFMKNCDYGAIYFIFDQNYLSFKSAYRVAGTIANEWCKK